ncbi:MAG: type II toxin-antitoxin system RelE/ParE family toxin [Bacteroidota bacterium]
MRKVDFYKSTSNKCPVTDFLDTLSGKQVQKITWVLEMIEELKIVPKQYLKKLTSTDDIWEVRVVLSSNIFRLLGFFDGNNLVILTNGFVKKTQKTPQKEIKLAEKRKKDYLKRKGDL